MNIDKILDQLETDQRVDEEDVNQVCSKVIEILKDEKNLIRLNAPISICGDIHGQFADLMELFKVGGRIPETSYLFLGDYVDRGAKGFETILYLFCLKVKHPYRIYLIRGNHESRQTTRAYGFFQECVAKYKSINVWEWITNAFDYLPLAAVIENRIFCVHGGLSPKIKTLDDINQLNRIQEIPIDGAMSDLMWSDPDGNFVY